MDFQMARANMVAQQVRPWYVFNDSVLSALSQIPRENFVPSAFHNLAYSDTDIPIGIEQTMLSPKVVGRALQALALTGHEHVLEIGTGTGYVTACLGKLASKVVSIEIDENLFKDAQKNLSAFNFRNLTLEKGDGVEGWEIGAPFDAIIVTGSYPLGVPEKICLQLKPNGRLFGISGVTPSMQAVLIERKGETFSTQSLFETVVPALLHAKAPETFQF